jgi:hypothetical protein
MDCDVFVKFFALLWFMYILKADTSSSYLNYDWMEL